MEGLKLLGTFLGIAVISIVIAIVAGLIVDRLPAVHDLFSVLVFFGTTAVLLVVSWPIAVRLTRPKHTTHV
jgi:hypothetical protein